MATQKRMIGLPAEVNKPWANSTIAWGTGITKIPVPPSVSNPASLTPWVTPKPTFSDNIAKPILPKETTPVIPKVQTTPLTTPTSQAAPKPTAAPTVWAPITQPWMLDINDPNNYNLTGYTVDDFLKLDPTSQLKANEFWKSQNLRLQDTTNKLNYTNEVNANKDFLDKQNTINQETAKLNNQNAEIQRQQNMRAEEKSVRDLAQNVWFLWSQGRPVQSAGMMNAYADAINESNQKLSEIRTIQDNMRSMQELGIEFDANQYTEQIRRLNQDLKDKTWQVFQDAINAYNAEERAWMIDSPSKMLKLQQEILARADFSVAWFVQKNLDDIRVMNDNITSHIEAVKVEAQRAEVLRKEQAQTQAEFVKNQNTVNKDMSQALWHYVNGNWQALTTTEWAIIPFAKDMPNPSYDPNTWVAVVRQADAQGNPVPVIQQIAPMSQDYKMWLQLKQAQLNKIQQEMWTSEKTVTVDNPDWTKSTKQYNPSTWAYDIDVTWNLNYKTWSWVPITDAIAKAIQSCTNWAQCWKFVNDVLQNAGKWRLIGDSYQSKINAIQKIWEARSTEEMWTWSIFTYPVTLKNWTQSPNWHIGIITAVNQDWTVNILDYNYKGDERQRERTNVSTSEILNKWWLISKPIITNENTPQAKVAPSKDQMKANTSLQTKLNWDQRIKDYQWIMWSFNKMQEVAKNWVNKQNKAAVDQTLIMLFNKILDPNSVVKEGEYARSQEWQAYFDWLRAKYNKFVYGWQGIDDNTRNEMLSVVWDLKNASQDSIKTIKQWYLDTVWDIWATEDFVNNYFKSYEWWQTQSNTTLSNQWTNPWSLSGWINRLIQK